MTKCHPIIPRLLVKDYGLILLFYYYTIDNSNFLKKEHTY